MMRIRIVKKMIIMASATIFYMMVSPSWGSSDLPPGYLAESFRIQRSPETRSLKVGGNLDETRFLWPNMPAKKRPFSRFRITNDGDQDVINPRLRINGFRVPLSSDELIESLTHNSNDPLDRVIRTFYAVSNYSVHALLNADRISPLSYFSYQSYGVCDEKNATQAGLWNLFGYRWRNSDPHNHSSSEVEIHGKTVHLDTDLQAFYLKYDNKTIASAQDIHDDPMLVIRSSNERSFDRFPRMADDPEIEMYFSSERIAALYNGMRVSAPPLTLAKPVKESVRIVLRPGESYGWNTGERKVVNSFNDDPNIATVARDVLWETHLDLARKTHHWFLRDERKRRSIQNREAVDLKGMIITIPYRLPFPLLGMKIHLIPTSVGDAEGLDPNEKVLVRITAHGKTIEVNVALQEILKGKYSFDHLVKEMPFPLMEFKVVIAGSKLLLNGFSLSGIQIDLNCLSTIFALRALRAGDNTLVYSDESTKRSVRIVAETAQEQTQLPRFPDGRFYPSGNTEIPESKLRFAWPQAADDAVAGYHFQISAFPDMRYPLSPTFDRLVKEEHIKISKGAVEFRLPWHGMLPVREKLYWRVRPFNQGLLAGDWSKTASFKVLGPGAPEQIKVTEREGKILLSWKAAADGTTPANYEIHASNLQGFIPVNKPHRVLGLSDDNTNKRCWYDTCATAWPIVPSTFFTSTRETHIVLIPSEMKNLKYTIGAHWRVIAVDAQGSRSCPSPQASLRTPMLVPPDIVILPPGEMAYQVPVISTLGRIWIKEKYDMGLWSKPHFTFSLKSNPSQRADHWEIDKTKGLIKGTLKANEEISLQVSVQDQYGRKDSKALKFKTALRQ